MSNAVEYCCSKCGATPGRANLFVKRVQFTTMGEGARTVRSRVVGWLCGRCVNLDPDYNRESQAGKKEASRVG